MGMLLSRSPKGDDLVTRREPREKGMECGDGGGCLEECQEENNQSCRKVLTNGV